MYVSLLKLAGNRSRFECLDFMEIIVLLLLLFCCVVSHTEPHSGGRGVIKI